MCDNVQLILTEEVSSLTGPANPGCRLIPLPSRHPVLELIALESKNGE